MRALLLFIVMLPSLLVRSQNGRVGIGTTTPIAKLEVIGEGSASTTNNLILKNLIGDTIFRVRNDGRIGIGYNGSGYGRTLNIGGPGINNGINFYSNGTVFGGAVFATDTSIVIWSQTGIDDRVIIQPTWGKVGIGTHSPQTKFDVNGDFKLGESGTVLKDIIKVTVPGNIPSFSGGSSATLLISIPGANVGGTVHVSPQNSLPSGVIISYARVNQASLVEVRFFNASAEEQNPPAMNFFITVIN